MFIIGIKFLLLIVSSHVSLASWIGDKYDMDNGVHTIRRGQRSLAPQSPDEVLFTEKPFKKGKNNPPIVIGDEFCYPARGSPEQVSITKYEVIDQEKGTDGALAFEVSGGTGQGQVCLFLKSQPGKGYNYEINVYGYHLNKQGPATGYGGVVGGYGTGVYSYGGQVGSYVGGAGGSYGGGVVSYGSGNGGYNNINGGYGGGSGDFNGGSGYGQYRSGNQAIRQGFPYSNTLQNVPYNTGSQRPFDPMTNYNYNYDSSRNGNNYAAYRPGPYDYGEHPRYDSANGV